MNTSLIAFQFELFFVLSFPRLVTLFFEGRGVGRCETTTDLDNFKTNLNNYFVSKT